MSLHKINIFRNGSYRKWSDEEIHHFGDKKEIIIKTIKKLRGKNIQYKSKGENKITFNRVGYGKAFKTKLISMDDVKKRLFES